MPGHAEAGESQILIKCILCVLVSQIFVIFLP